MQGIELVGVHALLQELGSQEKNCIWVLLSTTGLPGWPQRRSFDRDALCDIWPLLLMHPVAPEDFTSCKLRICGSSFMDSDDQGSPTAEPYLGKRCEEGNVP